MDRPAVPPSSDDDHWAPEHLVLARSVLTYAGRLLVQRDEAGDVVVHSPLAGMAAVEQRYPSWALGPFGHVETERELPSSPGVFALVQAGRVRYVSSASDLARELGHRGLGQISRRDCTRPAGEERCRLNRLVVAEARHGRTVELYVLVTRRSRFLPGRAGQESPADVAARLSAEVRDGWHLPS